jgi:predicted PurR-regulated permease PerM
MDLPPASPLPPPPVSATGDRRSRAQNVASLFLALGLFVLGVFTLRHFLGALAWAAIFAIALWPLYHRTIARFGTGRHNLLLPAVFTLAIALVFIVPIGLVGIQLAKQADIARDWIRDVQANGITEPDLLEHLPFGQVQVDSWWQQNLGDPGSARALVQRTTHGHVAGVGREIGERVIHGLTGFVFTLLTLFFLFRDGLTLTRQMRRGATRAFGPSGERIGQQIIASVHGTVNGLVLVGLGEGLLLGAVYGLAGVPQATVFGVLTAIAAMIPFAAPVVFLIAALLLVAQGSIAWAIVVVCLGMAVTFVADHFIRPLLIGGTTKLPFIWVLLGILGGVEVWGLIGLFLGPAIMAALILLWREWVGDGPV